MGKQWLGDSHGVMGFSMLALAALVAPHALAASVSAMDVKSEGDMVRLMLETSVGVFVDAGLNARGESMELRLKGVSQQERDLLLEKFSARPAVVKSVRVLPAEGDFVRVLLEFAKPVHVLDETVVVLSGDQSRWEIVLSTGEPRLPAVDAPALTQVRADKREGRLDIALLGSTGLVAEAAFLDKPHRLVVDLPGVPLAQAKLAAEKFHGEAGLIRSLRAIAPTPGQTRLVFELTEPADLVDTQGVLLEKQGQVLMSLVPDAGVQTAQTGALTGFGFEAVKGTMQFRLAGIGGSRVNAYTLESPSRLVVDFLGWKPEQVMTALARFRMNPPAGLGQARLDTTRTGSARVVFDLPSSAAFRSAKSVNLATESNSDALVETLLISLAPGADFNLQESIRRGPMNMRFRRELKDGREPGVVIRPLQLEGAGRYANAALRPEAGGDYGLLGMLSKAMTADPKYAAAKAEYDAAAEIVPQARSGVLPIAAFDYQRSVVRQDVTQASNPSFPTGASSYPNSSMTLTITQPLYKPQSRIKVDQAAIAIEQAKLNVVAAEQDLILRVATAYLNMLAANDGLELAQAEREATQRQFDLAKGRLEAGLGTIVQLRDTEARLALTHAKEIESQTRLDDAKVGIKEIVGEVALSVQGFKSDFEVSTPFPSSFEPWVDAAMEQNLALQSRKLAVDIAGLEIARQRAGNRPTLNLVGSFTRQDAGGSLYGAGQKSDVADIGLRLNIPLTDGGMTSSLTREAVARNEKAVQEHEMESRHTERLARSAFSSVVASTQTLGALRKAVIAQEGALQLRLEGFNSGLYNVVAVMDAYRLYHAAQRDFLQVRYDYLINRLKLKQAVGTLGRGDLEDIDVLTR
ncbi:MAG: TolC family outer membrane protein [Comamonadaceae bacterium]